MSSESARKEFNELRALIRRRGYKVAPSKSGHVTILDGKGRKVIDEHGPVILSTTPSDFRARDLAVQRLLRAGVLAESPYKPQKKKDGGGLLLGEPQPDAKLRKQEKQKDEARSRHERTQAIRARVEPFIARLGGWKKRGTQTELADVLYDYTKDTPCRFASAAAAKANVVSLRKGGTLSDNAATCWEALLDDLDQAPDPLQRWFTLVREARGLPPSTVEVFAQTARSIVAPDEQDVKVLMTPPRNGASAREYEQSPIPGEPHPLLEMHRNGGVRWWVDWTLDELNDLNRTFGFFEGLSVLEPEACSDALARLRQIIEKIGEARFKQLAERQTA